MAGRHLVQDWLDRCYIALERDRDLKLEEALANRPPEKRPGRKRRKLTAPELREAKRKLLRQMYGTWPIKGEVELPENIDWENQVERSVYNTVYHHNRRQRERQGL
jgi:hypothetical protein